MKLQILTEIQNENDSLATSSDSQENVDQKTQNQLNNYSIEENNNILIGSEKTDHIFDFFPRKNCELGKKLEHKLKSNLK